MPGLGVLGRRPGRTLGVPVARDGVARPDASSARHRRVCRSSPAYDRRPESCYRHHHRRRAARRRPLVLPRTGRVGWVGWADRVTHRPADHHAAAEREPAGRPWAPTRTCRWCRPGDVTDQGGQHHDRPGRHRDRVYRSRSAREPPVDRPEWTDQNHRCALTDRRHEESHRGRRSGGGTKLVRCRPGLVRERRRRRGPPGRHRGRDRRGRRCPRVMDRILPAGRSRRGVRLPHSAANHSGCSGRRASRCHRRPRWTGRTRRSRANLGRCSGRRGRASRSWGRLSPVR
jgi:hypothetical protein